MCTEVSFYKHEGLESAPYSVRRSFYTEIYQNMCQVVNISDYKVVGWIPGSSIFQNFYV